MSTPTWPPTPSPTGNRDSKKKLLLIVGGVIISAVALLASCGIGGVIGASDATDTAPSTTTLTTVSTVTVTASTTQETHPSRTPSASSTTPAESSVPRGLVAPTPEESTRTTIPRVPTTTQESGAYYSSCAEARAAGAAPMYLGQPGYRRGLDRDGDGVACDGS